MTLSTRVLLGIVAGIAVGLFFGELVAPIGVVGQAFILLLQMTVLPYVSISLIKALGGLTKEEAWTLGRKAGGVLLLLWGIALLAVLLLPLSFPDWTSASFFSSALVEERESFDFLHLFIPANPFQSLSENVVPAVVVFSVSLGIALIPLREKGPLIRAFSTLTDALGSVATFVVGLAPYGVFAIAAEAGGTMDLEQIRGLQVYVVAYIGMALLLSLWVLPALITTLTPLRYGEIFQTSRDALVTAFATGNLFVVLSILTEKTKELARLRTGEGDGDDTDSFVEVVIPTAFALPSAGKLLSLAFIPFAGWLSGAPLPLSDYPTFAIAGLFTFFGHTYVAVPSLLDMFRIPSDTMQLFVVMDSIVANRFGSLIAGMHILTMGLLSAAAASGHLRDNPPLVARYAAITVVATVAILLGVRFGFDALGSRYEGYELFADRGLLDPGVPAKVLEAPPTPPEGGGAPASLDEIRGRGTLRVAFPSDALPQAFRNEGGALVGFDVELMHHLARDLGVELEFLERPSGDLVALLESGAVDLGVSKAVTPDWMERVRFSAPVQDQTMAFIVDDHLRVSFNTRGAIKALPELRLAVPPSPYYIEKLRAYLPQAEIVEISSPRDFFRGRVENVDALAYTAEAGSAWCLIYPRYSVAVPHPDLLRLPMAFPVAHTNDELASFLDLWLQLKDRDGTLERLFDYWYRGQSEKTRKVRWSILRDVLGWGEPEAT